MELSLLLAEQILSLIIIVFIGYVIGKLHFVPDNTSQVIASLVLYVIAPCIIFDAFQIDYTSEKILGLVIGVVAALFCIFFYIAVMALLKKPLHLSKVDQASAIYGNTGNLIMPLVASVLGTEYVFYTCAYNSVQTAIMWIHGYQLMTDQKKLQLKKIVTNPNIIAVCLGVIFFILKLRVPAVLGTSIAKLGNTIGPLSMLNVGLIMAKSNITEVFKDKRVYMISMFRLIILPLLFIGVIALSGVTRMIPAARMVLLVSVLAAAAPGASTITQLAEVTDNQPVYAGKINILTTLCCIVTMPVMIMLYQIIC